jgi:type IV secretory pathway protease TraF
MQLKRRLLTLCVGAAGVVTAITWIATSPPPITFNTTNSIRIGVYVRDRSGRLDGGAAVRFKSPPALDTYLGRTPKTPTLWLLKSAAGLAGSRFCTGPGGAELDGRQLPVIEKDNAGSPLPIITGCWILPIDQLVVLGENDRSLDSRYYGPIRTADIEGIYRPLWTPDFLQ